MHSAAQENATCDGNHVSILVDGETGVETRYHSVHCRCGSAPGNPGMRVCGFTNYSTLESEAVAIERIEGGRSVSYEPRIPDATHHTAATKPSGKVKEMTAQLQPQDLIGGEEKFDPNKSPVLPSLGAKCKLNTSSKQTSAL